MNTTINLKETSQWLENINPEDVLLRDVNPCLLPEALPESMMILKECIYVYIKKKIDSMNLNHQFTNDCYLSKITPKFPKEIQRIS